jgi:hypothetical protein
VYQDPNDPNLPNTYYYSIVQEPLHTVYIHHGIAGQEFWFDAAVLDGNGQYAGPGNIHSIAADADAGAVAIKIAGSGHEYGADTVDAITLRSAGDTYTTIGDLKTQGDIGATGPIEADRVTGHWVVGVDATGNILDDLRVGCFLAILECNTLTNLYVLGEQCVSDDDPTPPPQVWIWGDLAGTIESRMTDKRFDHLVVYGAFTGSIDIYGPVGLMGLCTCDAPGNVHLRGSAIGFQTGRGPALGASITVDGNVLDLWLGYPDYCPPAPPLEIAGQVHVVGNVGGIDGVLLTRTPLLGTITIDGDVTGSAQLWAGGTGTLDVGGRLNALYAGSDVLPPVGLAGTVVAGALNAAYVPFGDLSGQVFVDETFYGTIQVGSSTESHDLTGTLEFAHAFRGPGIEIWGNLGSATQPGQIKIDGSFGNGSALSWIYAHGSMLNAASFVTVDYDGFHPSHRWGANGRVRVGNNIYTHNTPAMHIYEITSCKGDMDNSGMTLFNDMAPFKLALTNPAGYAAAYPGLAGAMLYHGDLDCDGDIDLDDSNVFSSFIGHCMSTCNGGARLTAETLAAGILVTVPEEDLADVADLVAQTEDSRYDQQDQQYWHEVSAELGQ